ncbi:MAG: hypothetical protein AVDCRST_MAG96-1333 [uncultured Segetibacter sp.]|uniref:Uncharacterized protein n=1 Tax=uncultured Segetibacter sp. TaxID=481133 RepID=A0A6J4SAD2_9BACT|nr:MAG: hypothetical protein AVDCRST_MAG96-1333 [uncultured Segetibacter sp.]
MVPIKNLLLRVALIGFENRLLLNRQHFQIHQQLTFLSQNENFKVKSLAGQWRKATR